MSSTLHIQGDITPTNVVRLAKLYPGCWQSDGKHKSVIAYWGNAYHIAGSEELPDFPLGDTLFCSADTYEAIVTLSRLWAQEDVQLLRVTDSVTVTLENLPAEKLAMLASVLMVQYGPDGPVADSFHHVIDWLNAKFDEQYVDELLVKYGVRA